MQDVRRVYNLFIDVKRSTQYLIEYQNEFMFSELPKEELSVKEEDSSEEKRELHEKNSENSSTSN